MQAKTGISFPLVEADAGATGLPDASFDLVVSEYGASIWVDPYRWIPEAARLVRPGGRLAFLGNSPLVILCSLDEGAATTTLQRPQFDMHRFEWEGEVGVEFHLPHGEWITLLRANDFEVERLIEVRAPRDAKTHEFYAYVTADWAKQWPCEDIWVARKSPH
jgi:SAM-dependent methyltransferase